MGREIKEWWNTSALVLWWEEDVLPWFTVEKWQELFENIKTSLKTKWDETVGQWITDLQVWWDKDVSPWFTLAKWKELFRKH